MAKTAKSVPTKQAQAEQLAQLVKETKELLRDVDSKQWQIGDLLIKIQGFNIDGKPRNLKQIHAEFFGPDSSCPVRYSTLAQYRQVAAAFSAEERKAAKKLGATWHDCEIARQSKADCVTRKVGTKDEPILDYLSEYLKLASQDGKRSVGKREITNSRIKKLMEANTKAKAGVVEQVKRERSGWAENCHNRCCIEVLADMPDASVDLLFLDPPYAQYDKVESGKLVAPMSPGLLFGCANETREEALKVTVGAIKQAKDKVKPNGFMVLFQAATEPDRPEVVTAMRNAGFMVIRPRYWKKKLVQPGDYKDGHSYETERVLIAARTMDAFKNNRSLAGRSDVVTDDVIESVFGAGIEDEYRPPSRDFYHQVRKGERRYGDSHQFEKPIELCMLYLEKLTSPGDFVFDAFGCTASMVEACIGMDRRWQYCELHKENYNLGVSRIATAIENKAAADVPALTIIPKDIAKRAKRDGKTSVVAA